MKTIKEAAIEYADSIYKNLVPDTEITNTHDDLWNYTTIDFKKGVEFAQRWIDPKEELPEDVIGFNEYGSVKITEEVLVKTTCDYYCNDEYDYDITHRTNNGKGWKWIVPTRTTVIGWRPIELK